MKKTITYILLAVLILLVMASCDKLPFTAKPKAEPLPIDAVEKQNTTGAVYENKKYGFTITIPKSWEGKYEITDDADKGVIIRVASEGAVTMDLASINKMPATEYLATTKPSIELARKKEPGENADVEYAYAIFYDETVPSGGDQSLKDAYSAMLKDLKDIAKSFKLK